MQLTASGCRFIVRGIPQGHMVGGIAVIWEILIEESMRIRVFGDTAINTGVYAIRGKRRLVYENPHPE